MIKHQSPLKGMMLQFSQAILHHTKLSSAANLRGMAKTNQWIKCHLEFMVLLLSPTAVLNYAALKHS